MFTRSLLAMACGLLTVTANATVYEFEFKTQSMDITSQVVMDETTSNYMLNDTNTLTYLTGFNKSPAGGEIEIEKTNIITGLKLAIAKTDKGGAELQYWFAGPPSTENVVINDVSLIELGEQHVLSGTVELAAETLSNCHNTKEVRACLTVR